MKQKTTTPCIGVCSTGLGDDVCRGCKRYSHEVIQWNSFSDSQKSIINQRLENYLVKIVSSYFMMLNSDLLRQQMEHQQLRFNIQQNPYCWIFELLKQGASQINYPEDFGFRLISNTDDNLSDIKDAIDIEFYQLSLANYERYIRGPLEKKSLKNK